MESLSRRKLLEAILTGNAVSLDQQLWEITVHELESGSCCYRKALVDALDGSDFLSPAQRAELLHRYFTLSQPRGQASGSPEAKCFVGILLCFHRQREDEGGLAKEGAQFLLSAYHQQCNLAALLLALCYECGKGVACSVESAVQCYSMAAQQGYQLAQIFLQECLRDFKPPAATVQPPAAQVPSGLQQVSLDKGCARYGALPSGNTSYHLTRFE